MLNVMTYWIVYVAKITELRESTHSLGLMFLIKPHSVGNILYISTLINR